MNRVEAALRRAAADLDKSGHPWALVGGFAVSARTSPRFTNDVDMAVMVDGDPEAEALVRAFLVAGYEHFSSIEHENGRLATVRLRRNVDNVHVTVDLLFASSGIEREIAQQAESLDVGVGLTLPVARIGHLIALKLLARDDVTRPQDHADLRNLIAVASHADRDLARRSVELIEARGYNRNRDLRAALDAASSGAESA